jgi:hypothetical protein
MSNGNTVFKIKSFGVPSAFDPNMIAQSTFSLTGGSSKSDSTRDAEVTKLIDEFGNAEGACFGDYLFWSGTEWLPATSTGNAVHLGCNSGLSRQGLNAVAIGSYSGQQEQGIYTVAIGGLAGQVRQGDDAVALGYQSGYLNQGNDAVAVGIYSGNANQGNFAVAVGSGSGYDNQGQFAIAIGANAGVTEQGLYSIAIGSYAGNSSQGSNAIAIGNFFNDQTAQPSNSIIINASDAVLTAGNSGLYVAPIRPASEVSGGNFVPLWLDTNTNEIVYNDLD